MKVLVSLIFFLPFCLEAACPLKEGDLIFTDLDNTMGELARKTTGSDWTHVGILYKRDNRWVVVDSLDKVREISLEESLSLSREKKFSVKRPKFSFDLEKLKKQTENYIGKDYDYLLGWGGDSVYCSELVWRVFNESTGKELGEFQKIAELNLDKLTLRIMRMFHSRQGLEFDEEAWKAKDAITPVRMMSSPDLNDVTDYASDKQALKDCH